MRREAAKFVPKLLNFKQKQRRTDIAQEMLTTFNDDADLLKKVITSDESWMYHHNESAQKSQDQKSTSRSVISEGFAHCFLRLQWRVAS